MKLQTVTMFGLVLKLLLVQVIVVSFGCGESSIETSGRITATEKTETTPKIFVGDWQFTSDALDSIYQDSFASSFIAGRTMSYEQQGMSKRRASRKAESDYKSEFPNGAPSTQHIGLPVLSVSVDQSFEIKSDDGILLAGKWQAIEDGGYLLKPTEADGTAVLSFAESGETLNVVSGDLFVPTYGFLNSDVFRRASD